MKRLVSVVLSSLLMASAMFPPSALASSPGMNAARQGKVQVIQLRGEDIGPATYHATRTFTPDVKPTGGMVTPDGKPAGWYEATSTIDRYSWLGIWVYSLTVYGPYHSNGTIIDQYGTADWSGSAGIMWSVGQGRASWAQAASDTGKAKASAVFTNQIPTPWGGIQLHQVSDYVEAYALP